MCKIKDKDADYDNLNLGSTPLSSDVTLGRLLLSQAQFCLLENEDTLEFISQVVENMYEVSHSYKSLKQCLTSVKHSIIANFCFFILLLKLLYQIIDSFTFTLSSILV